MEPGATYLGNHRCEFVVWAPQRQQVELRLLGHPPRTLPMQQNAEGYWRVTATDVQPGDRYEYHLDGQETRPDPASRYQPQGVHRASAVVDHAAYVWQDSNWRGIPLSDYILYETHVGTFSAEGSFDAIIPRLDHLKTLGITALELMPVAQFPGGRNWGYDGVYPFAVQQSYGGPAGLKRLVDACHQAGVAVVMDVVYNHLGPEGNYTSRFGPYTTDRYRTPWGSAINYDGADSDGVRQFFISNALSWFRDYHIDALRLDAVQAIYDFGAKHLLAELAAATQSLSQQLGRPLYLIAESDLNDVRLIHPPERGGYGLDAQWSDDFHHSLHVRLTGETLDYYQDFTDPQSLATAYRQHFVYNWKYSPFRRRHYGSDARHCPPQQFVVCAQNHDQVGNRMLGERLSQLLPLEALKLAASTILLSPYIPLLFMGEEYGETQPFLYFVSHGDADLIEAVRQGRKAEFRDFYAQGEPPDAASAETFAGSKLNWALLNQERHQALFQYYRRLIELRQQWGIAQPTNRPLAVTDDRGVLQVQGWQRERPWLALLNFGEDLVSLEPTALTATAFAWRKQLDSADPEWFGDGAIAPPDLAAGSSLCLAPYNTVLYQVIF
jgi:maltooligosyltrehalose trehalohydrolase